MRTLARARPFLLQRMGTITTTLGPTLDVFQILSDRRQHHAADLSDSRAGSSLLRVILLGSLTGARAAAGNQAIANSLRTDEYICSIDAK